MKAITNPADFWYGRINKHPEDASREEVWKIMKAFAEQFAPQPPSEVSNSYHDTVVIIDGDRFEISTGSYGYILTCCRVSGWELRHKWGSEDKLIGNEFNNDFQIQMNGKVIFQSSH